MRINKLFSIKGYKKENTNYSYILGKMTILCEDEKLDELIINFYSNEDKFNLFLKKDNESLIKGKNGVKIIRISYLSLKSPNSTIKNLQFYIFIHNQYSKISFAFTAIDGTKFGGAGLKKSSFDSISIIREKFNSLPVNYSDDYIDDYNHALKQLSVFRNEFFGNLNEINKKLNN